MSFGRKPFNRRKKNCPFSGENAPKIDYKDFYAFSSNWEPSYFVKSIDKSQIEKIIGTRSMLERKSSF